MFSEGRAHLIDAFPLAVAHGGSNASFAQEKNSVGTISSYRLEYQFQISLEVRLWTYLAYPCMQLDIQEKHEEISRTFGETLPWLETWRFALFSKSLKLTLKRPWGQHSGTTTNCSIHVWQRLPLIDLRLADQSMFYLRSIATRSGNPRLLYPKICPCVLQKNHPKFNKESSNC